MCKVSKLEPISKKCEIILARNNATDNCLAHYFSPFSNLTFFFRNQDPFSESHTKIPAFNYFNYLRVREDWAVAIYGTKRQIIHLTAAR